MTSKPDPHLTPTIPAPAGQQSKLVDPPNKDYIYIVCCVLIIFLSTPCVVVRIYTRIRIKPRVWWDDLTCFIGWAFMIVLSSWLIHVLRWGGGSDLWNVSKADWASFKKHFKNTQIIARVGMCCTKISFLLFYQRLFIPAGKRFTAIWWSIWVVFWYNVLFAIALIIFIPTGCLGKEKIVAAGGQCYNEYAVLISASTINASSDVMILVIPIVAIWDLQMPTRRKMKIASIFFVGGLAVISSLVRLGYQIAVAKNKNQSVAIMVLSMLNLAEQFIGVVVSCMPIFPAFYRHLRGTTTSDVSKPSYEQGKSASILGVSSKGNITSERSKRSKRSAAKDPFPISMIGDLTTRGYQELDELEAQPQVHITKNDWATHHPSRAEGPGVSTPQPYPPDMAIVKDTRVEITSESRYP